ncbi:uncharacterized protein KY384_002920 [Bacidia gigantensis]|uniref:uncharacterized protein n=1 Tax=Bacidia gigantensis TaxID=2732470 RepID=UPI001D051640|nr:uncharacterized protein KY384_002920 [Bacidia gigantensis]KAG8531292.1 hypothetical protein KY384_002920 [Bacidia gigantensis]
MGSLATTTTRIEELSTLIASKTQVLNEYFQFHGFPTPSFDVDGPLRVVIPPQLTAIAKAHLIPVTLQTQVLALIYFGRSQPYDIVSLQAIYRYKIATSFPVGGEASYEDIAKTCGVDVVHLRRLMRHAMTNHIFSEPRKGFVAHTAASRALAQDKGLSEYVGMHCEEAFPASARVLDALDKFGTPQDPSQTGFSLANNTDVGFYDELQKYPERAKRFRDGASAVTSRIPMEPFLVGYDWASLGNATVVDVGGSYGSVSIGLAKRFPNLSLIVQDFPATVEEGAKQLPESLKDRVKFSPYSILEEQPIKDADLYLFRAVFHNWPDAYVVKILKNQVPALKKGARILISDHYAPEPGVMPPMVDRQLRNRDLDMLANFGARELGNEEWPVIMKQADPGLRIVSTKMSPPGSTNGIMEVIWEG